MDSLDKFLAWFDGFSENIPDQPDAKQWARVCSRIKALEAAAESRPPVAATPVAPRAPVVVQPPPPPTFAKTTPEWSARYQVKLIEIGLDDESARDMVNSTDVDLGIMPEDRAREDAGPMMN